MAHYRFLTMWVLDGTDIDAVYNALFDYERWPEWWRGVVSAVPRDATSTEHVGSVAHHAWRSLLPYTLHFDIESIDAVRPTMLEGRASGDLVGTGRWELSVDGERVVVRYLWDVETTRAWMNIVAPVAGSIFRWNHDWVMHNGGVGISKLLGARLVPSP